MENFSYPIKLEPLNRPVKHVTASSVPPARVKRAKTKKIKKSASNGLREERERKGVTLEAIAESTRIPMRHLEELERGDVANWPTGVYARSWARDYANEVGIDPDRVIAIVAPIAEVEPTIDEIKQVREEVERARVDESPLAPLVDLMRKVAAVVVVLTLLVLAAIYLWPRQSAPGIQTSPAPVGTSGVSPAPAPAQSSSPATPSSAAPAQSPR